jgi:hypothetical protein
MDVGIEHLFWANQNIFCPKKEIDVTAKQQTFNFQEVFQNCNTKESRKI